MRAKIDLTHVMPLDSTLDGRHCIVIHENAQTDLGRLLASNAEMPFKLEGNPCRTNISEEWLTYAHALREGTNQVLASWVDDYHHAGCETKLTSEQREVAKVVMEQKIKQNYYLLDLLINEPLPITFVYHETLSTPRNPKMYVPMPGYAFLERFVMELRSTHQKRLKDKQRKVDKHDKKVAQRNQRLRSPFYIPLKR